MAELKPEIKGERWLGQLRFLKRLWPVFPYLFILSIVLLFALFPGFFAPYNPIHGNLLARFQPVGTVMAGHTYWLGTDQLGRDELSRLIYGARISLFTALAAVWIAVIIGGPLGLVAGYYRGLIGTIIMRFTDMVLAIPFLLLAILTVAVLGPSFWDTILVLGLTRWTIYARISYASTLKLAQAEFVQASVALGARPARILWRHIWPQVVPNLLVVATGELGLMVMFEAALSFLGLGVQPPNPSWGSMLASGQNYMDTAWWLITFPGLAVFLVVLSFNRLGDYWRDRMELH